MAALTAGLCRPCNAARRSAAGPHAVPAFGAAAPGGAPLVLLTATAAPQQQQQQQRASTRCWAGGNGNGNGAAPAAGPAATVPTSAETARTVVDLVAHGALSTIGEDGIPLGTYVSYVLDQEGQPILRLRADAVHTANLRRDAKCSLFVQPGEHPTRLLARVTLIGAVEPVPAELAEQAAAAHGTMHAGGVGVDAPADTDLYYRLRVDRCFYVGQLCGASAAEVLPGEAYRGAEPDPLRTCAAAIVAGMNADRLEDVMRIGCQALGARFEDMYLAEMLWVDRLGVYLRAVGQDGGVASLRVPFLRPVDDERDARSNLTMMAQVAWEAERTYTPVMVPSPTAAEPSNN